jgi:hypothetical protein
MAQAIHDAAMQLRETVRLELPGSFRLIDVFARKQELKILDVASSLRIGAKRLCLHRDQMVGSGHVDSQVAAELRTTPRAEYLASCLVVDEQNIEAPEIGILMNVIREARRFRSDPIAGGFEKRAELRPNAGSHEQIAIVSVPGRAIREHRQAADNDEGLVLLIEEPLHQAEDLLDVQAASV